MADDLHYKSITELLDILGQRDLTLGDPQIAAHYLSSVGHHRLSAYYDFFYVGGEKRFRGASLEDVINLYAFDRQLRLLLLGPLEKIEVGLRALIIKEVGDYLRHSGGSPTIKLFDKDLYALNDQNQRNYKLARDGCMKGAREKWLQAMSYHEAERKPAPPHAGIDPQELEKARKQAEAQRESKFREYYENLPAWAVLQSASFGPLTHIYAILKSEIAFPISGHFRLSRRVLNTTLFALKELRNSCAHHEPIWNWHLRRNRAVVPLFPKMFDAAAGVQPPGMRQGNYYRLYPYCALIHILLSYLSSRNSTWYSRLKNLVGRYDRRYSARMGFPRDWEEMPF